MRSVWFGPFGRPNTMSIFKLIPKDMFCRNTFLTSCRANTENIPIQDGDPFLRFGPFGRHNTMNTLKFIPEGMVFVEKRFW